MSNLLYITSSSYSGSTLLSFLLNIHPSIFSVSEMEGWHFSDNETFYCSCGDPINKCKFFTTIEKAFYNNSLPFKYNDFGTKYRVVRNNRINRYLTAAIPYCDRLFIEKIRDNIIRIIPAFRKRILLCDASNATFIKTALAYSNASVFIDATKDPFRIKFLERNTEIDSLKILYLIRDFRGVTLSIMENRNCSATKAFNLWLNEQQRIIRNCINYQPVTIYYEDICNNTDSTLAQIHEYIGLPPALYPGNFKTVEHHILGNTMRLKNISGIEKSERWKTGLASEDLESIIQNAKQYISSHSGDLISGILQRHLDS